ncbi:MAG: hypothetical protein QF464_10985, partial [Myxococcota bacterium]|nr:hypothetical protein [Myxococcota bacterium]
VPTGRWSFVNPTRHPGSTIRGEVKDGRWRGVVKQTHPQLSGTWTTRAGRITDMAITQRSTPDGNPESTLRARFDAHGVLVSREVRTVRNPGEEHQRTSTFDLTVRRAGKTFRWELAQTTREGRGKSERMVEEVTEWGTVTSRDPVPVGLVPHWIYPHTGCPIFSHRPNSSGFERWSPSQAKISSHQRTATLSKRFTTTEVRGRSKRCVHAYEVFCKTEPSNEKKAWSWDFPDELRNAVRNGDAPCAGLAKKVPKKKCAL